MRPTTGPQLQLLSFRAHRGAVPLQRALPTVNPDSSRFAESLIRIWYVSPREVMQDPPVITSTAAEPTSRAGAGEEGAATERPLAEVRPVAVPRLRLELNGVRSAAAAVLTAAAESTEARSDGGDASNEAVPFASSESSLAGCGSSSGISFTGLQHIVELFLSTDAALQYTAADLCHSFVRPATVPSGWVDVAELADPHARSYGHTYVHAATGKRQTEPPIGTRSFNAMIAAEPTMARYVGEPTHFLSSQWTGQFGDLVQALGKFVAARPEGSPECFFWWHPFAVNHHTDKFGA